MKLKDHPTVKAYLSEANSAPAPLVQVESQRLKKIAIQAGADDVGIIDLERDSMAEARQELQAILPQATGIMVLAMRINQSALQNLSHSVADLEFKQTMGQTNAIARKIVTELRRQGIRAVNLPAGFPYEAKKWPAKMWLTSDKLLAVEAGLGQMGWNRLLLHPKFGAAVALGSILVVPACDTYDRPSGYNPCIQCGLCLKACPVGAVQRTDDFDFTACYSHNYRERLGGFQNWVEQLADSRNKIDYRRRVDDHETISMWQNLSIGAQTRCDRCMAVCPAGQEAIGAFLDDRKAYTRRFLKPFTELEETIYVVKGSDAEQHVTKSFPYKTAKRISNGLRPRTARQFLESLFVAFQPNQSSGLDAVFQFSFTGQEEIQGTVTIRDRKIDVRHRLVGKPDLHVMADSRAWIHFLSKEISLLRMLVTRKLRLKGSPKLMRAFAKCFPS